MVIFPGNVTDNEINGSYEATPCQVKKILKNPLNEIVEYERSNYVKVQITLKEIAPWQPQVVRKYIFDTNAFDWAMRSLNSEIFEPNVVCPICGRYEFIRQYTGRNVLNVNCLNCVNDGYLEFNAIFSDETDELHDNSCNEDPCNYKVDWKKEGF